MKKHLLGTVGLVLACGLVVAGEKVSVGYDGRLAFEAAKIVVAPRLMNAVWDTCARKGRSASGADGETAFVFQEPSGGPVLVAGRLRAELTDGRVRACWTLDVKQDYTGNAFFLELTLPTEIYGGGWIAADGRRVQLPAEKRPVASLGAWKGVRRLEIGSATRGLVAEIPSGAEVLAQDNRKWNEDAVSVRVSLGANVLKAGETRTLAVAFATSEGVGELEQGKLTIQPGADWVPLHDTTRIAPGSALDFSTLGCADAPAGKYGRVVRRGAHFEFAKKPGVPQRFYGVNLCFGANYLNEADAEELADRLVRTGYNALRIHHYESLLCDTTDGTTIRPEKMAELDNLLNACIARGLYLTTDLFVSRNVPYCACGIDRKGNVPMQQYKELILFHDGAFQNYLAFSRALLNHVNPATGRRWADEPALAFLALVNEGNPGNHSYGFLKSLPEAKAAWRKWLAERKAQEPEAYADITEAIPGNCWQNSRQNAAYCLFLADVEIAFARKMKAFVRDEIKSEVLLTDLSCWKNPICFQLTRREYDYVDDHFYEDHPTFLETPWQLPSQCPNTNPVCGRNRGFEPVALHRLLDRPFTVTEFNYSGPGQYRGIGGIMLGAQAALQDYDGIWRFTWTHDPVSVLNPNPLAYFDVSRDPLQRMSERAVVALYLRRDLQPLTRTLAVVLPEKKVRTDLSCGPHKDIQDMWYGWFAKFGTWVGASAPAFATESLEFPEAYSATTDDFTRLAGSAAVGDGQVCVNRETGIFVVRTPRTAGFFVPTGVCESGPLKAVVSRAPAALWVSSLDGAPIADSRRMLLTHATDVQDTGMVYADRTKTVLQQWGRLPHLMRSGRAEVRLALAGKSYAVYALAADGTRRAEVPARLTDGVLAFLADTARDRSDATCLYEIVRVD